MPDGHGQGARNRPIAVVDIGSNSVRLVVFDGLKRQPLALHNEKATCELGRGLELTGRLEPAAIERAVASVTRFVGIARGWGARRVALLATAAVRDAANGVDLTQPLARRLGLPVTVLSGAAEARLSAMGVQFGIPGADGTMGDLGGGSLELVALNRGRAGRHATLPLGPLRLMDIAGSPTAPKGRDAIDRRLGEFPWLREARGRSFYAVGGAWRSLARLHMAHRRYPLRIIHHYRLSRADADEICGLVIPLGRQSLRRIVAVSRNRLDALPWAALALQRILAVVEPAEVVFSANGLREGHVLSLLTPSARREDPLIAACRDMVADRTRMSSHVATLMRWSAPLVGDETPSERRLRHGASILSDIGWREHPEYRAEHAYLAALQFPYNCLSHPDRAFLALALLIRYGGSPEAPLADTAVGILDADAFRKAQILGLALRLGHTLMNGNAARLARSRIGVNARRVVLVSPGDSGDIGDDDSVRRRLGALAAALDREPELAVHTETAD